MKIAMVAPGLMSVPPKGWGAVEILIWNYKLSLEKLGHDVTIFNMEPLGDTVDKINNGDFDFVHVQYDNHVGFFNRFCTKPFVCTTHYGFILQEHYWDAGYHSIHNDIMLAPGIIALSPEIEMFYRSKGYQGYINHVRNGAEVKKFRFSNSPEKDVICVGKIEPRKGQAELASLCNGEINADFVGEIVDHRFRENNTCKYLGTWTKETLYENLTNYKCLVLPSHGEAAPLVVPEALAAGLSVIVSEEASANLDRGHPGVFVKNLGDSDWLESIRQALNFNSDYRNDIRDYSEAVFDWDMIAHDYIKVAEDFING